jgi:hypothetical protein
MAAQRKDGKVNAMALDEKLNLDKVLAAAVIASWRELMPNDEKGSIHVEYDLAADGSVGYLQIWSSVRHGYWQLVCTYQISDSGIANIGTHFENLSAIDHLANTLDTLLQHQQAFLLPPNLGRQGLLQITPPTAREAARAAAMVGEALAHVNANARTPVLV